MSTGHDAHDPTKARWTEADIPVADLEPGETADEPMTEPTPDTPESELTGDGLRAAQAELSAAWATLENDVLHPGDFAPQIAELFRVGRRGVEAAYTRLAALPNRETAPLTADGLRAALYRVIGSVTDARVAELMRAAAIPLHGHPLTNEAGYVAALIRTEMKIGVDAILADLPNREAAPSLNVERLRAAMDDAMPSGSAPLYAEAVARLYARPWHDLAALPNREAAPSLLACPIDGKPAGTLSGNCGHSWSAALNREAAPDPVLLAAGRLIAIFGDNPKVRALGGAYATAVAELQDALLRANREAAPREGLERGRLREAFKNIEKERIALISDREAAPESRSVQRRKAVQRGELSDYQRGYVDGFDAPANVRARNGMPPPVDESKEGHAHDVIRHTHNGRTHDHVLSS